MDEFESLLAEYADLYRRTRIAKDCIDFNLDNVVTYAVMDMHNMLKSNGQPLEVLRDEVESQKECLAKLTT